MAPRVAYGCMPGPDHRRSLPSVDSVLGEPTVRALADRHGRARVTDEVRAVLAQRRGTQAGVDGLAGEVADRLRASLGEAVNATGVILHTNLGRAPLADAAIDAIQAAAGACTLEWRRDEGTRGSRHDHVSDHLRALTGAEDACAVNTNAGSVLLALCSLGGGEVVVSRGQLVEIGGGFRVPDILAASGLRLVEVGTTNRTRIEDYARAVGEETVAILRVHPSNFRTVGFTEEAPLADLAGLARERGIALLDDTGSGVLRADARLPDEPDVRASVAAGSDLVCFSADKLLGGPQAGLIVGRREAVARCTAHPLMRALRPDKLTLAALEATLALHRDHERAWREIPALRMLAASSHERRAAADGLARVIGGEVVATVGRVGGGTMPLHELASWAVVPDHVGDAQAFSARLRSGDPPVVTRIADGRVLIDVLALGEDDLLRIPDLVRGARA